MKIEFKTKYKLGELTIGIFEDIIKNLSVHLNSFSENEFAIKKNSIVGEYCDGQVQVLYDLIGISNNPPKFAKDYLINGKNIQGAIKDFHNYVKSIKN